MRKPERPRMQHQPVAVALAALIAIGGGAALATAEILHGSAAGGCRLWALGLRPDRDRPKRPSGRQLLRLCQRCLGCPYRNPRRQIPFRHVRRAHRQDPGTGARHHRRRGQFARGSRHRCRQNRWTLQCVHGRGADRAARRRPDRRRLGGDSCRANPRRHCRPDGAVEKRIRRQPVCRQCRRGCQGPGPQYAVRLPGRARPARPRLLSERDLQG